MIKSGVTKFQTEKQSVLIENQHSKFPGQYTFNGHRKMGTLQQVSVVKGCMTPVKFQYLHKIFEENVDRKYGQNVAVLFKGRKSFHFVISIMR
jgi:hypothetical protein